MSEHEELSFEQALKRLEEVVQRLESGETSLEESLRLFEEGMALKKLCTEKLERARAAIKKLVESQGGTIEEQEFDVSDLSAQE